MAASCVVYVVNQYPQVSHSFIRSEIQALEAQGVRVVRLAARGWDAPLVDPADREERSKTRYLLGGGAAPLLGALFAALLHAPGRVLTALGLALRMARGGDRSPLIHVIYFLEACLAARWARAAGATHIHAHFGSNSAEVAMLAGLIGALPFSFTVHGPEEFDKAYQWKLREKIRRASTVVAISSFCRSQLYRHADLGDWPKIVIIHCGLDDAFLNASTTPVPEARQLVCVGRLCEQKGQLLLLEAAAGLRNRGVDFLLILAGDGELREAIASEIAALGLGDRVTITGWVTGEQIRQLLQVSRGLVLPSFAEGLPVVIMEAMASSRPVLSTVIAGIPELVRDGVDGILVTAGDTDSLQAAMERLLTSDLATLDAMGGAAKARVAERHDAMVEARKLAALFGGCPPATKPTSPLRRAARR